MSLVIAIKDGNRIVLGADKQGTMGGNKSHTATKVWEVVGMPNCIMGGVGLARASQVIQWEDNLIDLNTISYSDFKMTDKYVSKVVAPAILDTLASWGITAAFNDDGEFSKLPAIPNTFVFAYKDKAWRIDPDMCVEEIEDFIAIGSGAEVARGSLLETRGKHPFERIARAIKRASETTTMVDDSVEILATEECPYDEEEFEKSMMIFENEDDIFDETPEELIRRAVMMCDNDEDIDQFVSAAREAKRASKEENETAVVEDLKEAISALIGLDETITIEAVLQAANELNNKEDKEEKEEEVIEDERTDA